ncbi:hypothetical protein CSKR_111974 [Clonorchis sinensis]|uniref:Uncharacterized protein n=1 Tax=Clonorchis sinensis TaxID=79923 RepID=A0A419Q3Q8_CLOSI|nr:hypothetical protein CSKR_111974 [Clonorchis sinensis]
MNEIISYGGTLRKRDHHAEVHGCWAGRIYKRSLIRDDRAIYSVHWTNATGGASATFSKGASAVRYTMLLLSILDASGLSEDPNWQADETKINYESTMCVVLNEGQATDICGTESPDPIHCKSCASGCGKIQPSDAPLRKQSSPTSVLHMAYMNSVIVIVGDPLLSQVKSSQVKSSQVKSSQVKSSQVKSSQVKSSQVKSSQVKSSQVKSSQVKSSQVKSSQVKSSQVKSSQVKSSQVKSSQVKSSQVKSSQVKSSQVKSSQVKSSQVKSSQVKSSQVKSSQVKSSQVKSSQVKSSQVKSSQVKSSQVKSSQVKSSQVKSSQVKSSQVKSSQVKSSQVKSSQVKSSQVKSSQVKSSQVKSSQVKSSQVKSSQVKSSEVKSSQAYILTVNIQRLTHNHQCSGNVCNSGKPDCRLRWPCCPYCFHPQSLDSFLILVLDRMKSLSQNHVSQSIHRKFSHVV